MYLSMMSEVMDEKPWLEEEEYSKKNAEIVAKILDMFDRNVTLGDKRRIAKYREVLQSRIKEKGFSIELRNWKRRYTYQGKEYDKKLAEIKNENSALKKKQQEDQQTIKTLEDQARKSKSEIQELRSDAKYVEREKTGQESLYKQQIQKLENDLAEEKKKNSDLASQFRESQEQIISLVTQLGNYEELFNQIRMLNAAEGDELEPEENSDLETTSDSELDMKAVPDPDSDEEMFVVVCDKK